MGSKTKIDWCDSSWNPVTGCLHGCEYCYARRIAERFGGIESREKIGGGYKKLTSPYGDNLLVLDEPVRKELIENVGYYDVEPNVVYCGVAPYPNFFNPTFHRYKLDEPQHWKNPRTIFVCSMADLFGEWVPDEWIEEVFTACQKAPQHRYLFLTKNPMRYLSLWGTGKLPKEHWYGHTITTDVQAAYAETFNPQGYNNFVSIEPLLGDVSKGNWIHLYKWVIIGAETGNRKDKVAPKREWVDNIVNICDNPGGGRTSIPIFMKESLRELMGDGFRQEYPWETCAGKKAGGNK